MRLLTARRAAVFRGLVHVALGLTTTLRFVGQQRQQVVDLELTSAHLGGALPGQGLQRAKGIVSAEAFEH